jgi:hypothetical protein
LPRPGGHRPGGYDARNRLGVRYLPGKHGHVRQFAGYYRQRQFAGRLRHFPGHNRLLSGHHRKSGRKLRHFARHVARKFGHLAGDFRDFGKHRHFRRFQWPVRHFAGRFVGYHAGGRFGHLRLIAGKFWDFGDFRNFAMKKGM